MAQAEGHPSPPYLRLQKSNCVLRHATGSSTPVSGDSTFPVVSAAAAAKLLIVPRFGSASLFIVLTRKLEEPATLAQDIPRESRLKNLLGSYGDVV